MEVTAMTRFPARFRILALIGLLLVATVAGAQQLPVNVSVAGDVATVQIGLPGSTIADMTITFDDATGLTPASLGVRADTINVLDPALVARLPSSTATTIPTGFPVMITVEPPASGGLDFLRQAHIDLHVHALSYTAGTRLRLFKGPLNGAFSDVTTDVLPGSVRTRGTTGGWSQMLVITDTRSTNSIVADKIAALHTLLLSISASERRPLQLLLNRIQTAVAAGHYNAAITACDAFRQRVSDRAGTYIPDEWRAARDLVNNAGDLMSGADTLRYSIAFLRDYGP
jgi:hypothetical protein